MIQLDWLEKSKIEALLVAREYIEDGTEQYICYALPESPVGDMLVNFISRQIHPYNSLEDWAANTCNNWTGECSSDLYWIIYQRPDLLRDARIRWIDAMIESIETRSEVKGDWI